MQDARKKLSDFEFLKRGLVRKGSRCLALHLPAAASVSLILSLRDGVAYESDEEWGMSHFLEHVHLQGCPQLPSMGAVSRAVEALGAQLSAFSTRDSVSYWVKVPAWHRREVFEVLCLLLKNSEFSPESVEKEKSIVAREMARERSNPRLMSHQILEESLLFPSALSRNVLGSDGRLLSFTPAGLKAHKKKYYCANNLFLAAAGNFGDEKEADFLSDFSGIFPRGKVPPGAPDSSGGTSNGGERRALVLNFPEMKQVNLALGWKIAAGSRREKTAWKILNTFLGVGFSSLLYRRLREERGLTYMVSTRLRFYGKSGIFQILLDVREEDIAGAVEAVYQALGEAAAGSFGEGDLVRARGMFLGNMALRLEDTMEWARWLSQSLLSGIREPDPAFLEEETAALQKKQLSRLAQKFLAPADSRLCLAGDASGILRHLPRPLEAEVF
ncbi:MAG: pitrilysin family protein [bacterium]